MALPQPNKPLAGSWENQNYNQMPPDGVAAPTGGMGNSPWSTPPPIAPPVQGGGMPPPPQNGAPNAQWMPQGYTGGTSFGGQSTTGAQAGAADYAGVQGFADKAYEQARRNIDPMQEQASRRMEQDLINKGIDPSSEQGKAMLDQQNRNFTDQNNAATFGALQFGQGIQNQMFGQNMANVQQAGQMQQADWANQRNNQNVYGQKYGAELGADVGWGNIGLGYNANDINRYGMDQRYNLGLLGNELGRQQQDFNEVIGYDNMGYRNDQFNRQGNQWQDQMFLALTQGMPPYGGGSTGTPTNPVTPWAGFWNDNFGQGA